MRTSVCPNPYTVVRFGGGCPRELPLLVMVKGHPAWIDVKEEQCCHTDSLSALSSNGDKVDKNATNFAVGYFHLLGAPSSMPQRFCACQGRS